VRRNHWALCAFVATANLAFVGSRLNRYSMPVTRSRTYMSDIGLEDSNNTTGFLFGDEDSNSGENRTTPTNNPDSFPALLRQQGYGTLVSAFRSILRGASSVAAFTSDHFCLVSFCLSLFRLVLRTGCCRMLRTSFRPFLETTKFSWDEFTWNGRVEAHRSTCACFAFPPSELCTVG
jgi:hypothetical protein